MAYNIISSVVHKFINLTGNAIHAFALSLNEVYTTEGKKFQHEFDIEFANGEERYFLYQVPADAGITAGFRERVFKSRDGAAELSLFWDSTGFTPGTLENVFNEYNKYTNGNQLEISEISAPTVEGTLRESDFLTSTGVGVNSSGGVSTDAGYRLYKPGSFGIVKVTNLHNATNRIILGYSWVEIPQSELTP